VIVYEAYPKVDFYDLTQDLAFEFPDFPTRSLVAYLRRAASIMCRDSDLVRHKAIITVHPRIDNYLLEPADADYEMERLSEITGTVPVWRFYS
jgi:hypothetical protein